MMMNELLREKYRVQKTLDAEANDNLAQYVANAHASVKEVEAKYGVKFKYDKPTLNLPKLPKIVSQPDELLSGGVAET